MTTLDLLTAYKAHHGGISDYKVAKLLNLKHQTVYAWKSGGTMSDETGIRIAQEVGLDPDQVVIDLHIERDKGHVTSPVWESIRDRLKVAASPVVVGFLAYGAGALHGGGLI